MPKPAAPRSLWSIRGIVPFFSIGFLNAFNDIGLKTLLYDAVQKALPPGPQLVAYQSVLQALVLIPFVAFFTPSGYLSDKWPKDRVIRWSAFAALPFAVALVAAFHLGSWNAAFWLLLLLAAQAAFYSPSKYGFVKELVGNHNLAEANSVIQGLTIVAILLSSFLYSIFFEWFYQAGTRDLGIILHQIRWASWPLLGGFVLEWLLSLRVPRIGKTDPVEQGDCRLAGIGP